METILNITNGDCAVEIMEEAGILGAFLPWRDVLHAGPVPADLTLQALSEVRARFIDEQGWGAPELVKNSFTERDNVLQSFRHYEKVILWFEHDLYDQLQILQLLDWFSANLLGNTELTMICTEQYLGSASVDTKPNSAVVGTASAAAGAIGFSPKAVLFNLAYGYSFQVYAITLMAFLRLVLSGVWIVGRGNVASK